MTHINDQTLAQSALGKKSANVTHYDPTLLFPVPRTLKRDALALTNELPFSGVDLWNAYELSWLNEKNKPEIAFAQFLFPCTSRNLIESKSFKLYLHSLNETVFSSWDDVKQTLINDLSKAAETEVTVRLYPLSQCPLTLQSSPMGESLDALDVSCTKEEVQVAALKTESTITHETLCSDLLKSNCLVTDQPDWGSVQITYRGPKINREGLLRYIISYRYHQGFHEHCVERIFMDILRQCKPSELTVTAKYTRRGGLDINPYRTNTTIPFDESRLIRQ